MSRRFRLLVATSLLAGTLAGCGAPQAPTKENTQVPTTPRSIAALAVEHFGREPLRATPDPDALGAWLRWEDDLYTQIVVYAKTPDHLATGCSGWFSACVEGFAGTGATLGWQLEQPEEDPGEIIVFEPRDEGMVAITFHGDILVDEAPTDLPEGSRLGTLLDVAAHIVDDPRLGLTTTQTLVDAEVPSWTHDPAIDD